MRDRKQREVVFRDYLISHPKVPAVCASMKTELTRRYARDIEAYTEGKDSLFAKTERHVLARGRGGAEELG